MKCHQLLIFGAAISVAWISFASAQETPCGGRCTFCADGQCVPQRHTFGFYETQWRRWPVNAPELVRPMQRSLPANPSLGPAVDPPAPDFEAEVDPKFPHRKSKPSGRRAPGKPTPLPAELPQEKVPDAGIRDENATDPFKDDLGLGPGSRRSAAVRRPSMQLIPSGTTKRAFQEFDTTTNLTAHPVRPDETPRPRAGTTSLPAPSRLSLTAGPSLSGPKASSGLWAGAAPRATGPTAPRGGMSPFNPLRGAVAERNPVAPIETASVSSASLSAQAPAVAPASGILWPSEVPAGTYAPAPRFDRPAGIAPTPLRHNPLRP